jgi:hypothetical protein
MPTKQFALEDGGEKRVEVSWKGIWKNFELKCDGQVIARAENQNQLKNGVSGKLPDGSQLEAKLETGFGNAGLKLFRDGDPLPGSAGDPLVRIKTAAGVVYFIAGLNLLIGAGGLLFGIKFLEEFGVGAIIFAVLFAVLGFFSMKRSRVALVLAIVLFAADAAFTLFANIEASGGRPPNIGFIFVRVFLIIAMVNGVKAMGELKTQSAPAAKA